MWYNGTSILKRLLAVWPWSIYLTSQCLSVGTFWQAMKFPISLRFKWVQYLKLVWPFANIISLIFPLKLPALGVNIWNLEMFCILLQLIVERHFRNTLGQISYYADEEIEAKGYIRAYWKSCRQFIPAGARTQNSDSHSQTSFLLSWCSDPSQWHCRERRDPKGERTF